MGKYNLDIKKYVYRHIRAYLRKPKRLAWLETLLKTLGVTIEAVNDFRDDRLRELDYNGQTIQLERVLNDVFDPVLRRIYIRHNIAFKQVLWYYEEGQDPYYLYYEGEVSNGTAGTSGYLIEQLYLFNEGEEPGQIIGGGDGTNGTSGEVEIDFEVVCPLGFENLEAQIRGFVDKYRNASRRYDVVYGDV